MISMEIIDSQDGWCGDDVQICQMCTSVEEQVECLRLEVVEEQLEGLSLEVV